jgi:hypothetical protein
MTEKMTAENFKPMTDDEIKKLWIEDGWRGKGESLEHFAQEIREEEEAVKVLLGLGFDVVSKSKEEGRR